MSEGKPIPKITWKKDGVIINDSSSELYTFAETNLGAEKRQSTLSFRGSGRSPETKLEPRDAGSYECVGSNVAGEATSTTQLLVLFKPRMRVNQLKFASQAGATTEIKCVAEAYPQPSFQWRRGGSVIANNGRFSLSSSRVIAENPASVWQSVLTVTGVQGVDYGAYECGSANDEGLGNVTVTLDKLSKPDPPTNLAASDDEIAWNAAVMRWKSGFNGGREQKFILRLTKETGSRKRRAATPLDQEIEVGVAGADVAPGTPYSYNISGLEPAQRYRAALEARNTLGGSDYAQKDFTTKEFPVKVSFSIEFHIILTHWLNLLN